MDLRIGGFEDAWGQERGSCKEFGGVFVLISCVTHLTLGGQLADHGPHQAYPETRRRPLTFLRLATFIVQLNREIFPMTHSKIL